MKVLIVDNGTRHLTKLKELLVGVPFDVVSYSDFNPVKNDKYETVILSGGHDFPVLGNESLLWKEFYFIKNSRAKILGICFGFELIARAFGADLEIMDNKEKGILDIEVVEKDVLFSDVPNFKVCESHRWVVRDSGNELRVLARSKDGIEAIKHKDKPIYAVQFHPEMFVEKTCGDEIFYNFLRMTK